MKISEVLGYAIFPAGFVLIGSVFYQTTQEGFLSWLCLMTALALLTIGVVCLVSGVALHQLSTSRTVVLWIILSSPFALGYFTQRNSMEWGGVVVIYALLLFLPRYLRESATPHDDRAPHASSEEAT